MERELISSFDGKNVSVVFWDETVKPKAVIVALHDFGSCAARFDGFARFLNTKGFIFVAFDMRGHGLTDESELGKGGASVFSQTVGDTAEVMDLVKRRYGLPMFLLAEGKGTFAARKFLSGETQIKAAIFISAGIRPVKSAKFGLAIAKRYCKKHCLSPAKLINRLTDKKYDKRFRDGINGCLTRNVSEIGRYNTDKFSGFICSWGFYYSFFKAIKALNKSPENVADKEIYLLTGGDDLSCKGGRLSLRLKKKLEKGGAKVRLKIYPLMRRDILHEYNKSEVFTDAAAFFDSVLTSAAK